MIITSRTLETSVILSCLLFTGTLAAAVKFASIVAMFKKKQLQDVYGLEIDTKATESIIKLPNGERNMASWIPDNGLEIKGIILLSHGLHEHCLRFYRLALALKASGFAVFAIDHFAHGKSPGVKVLITDYNILSNDFTEFSKLVLTLPELKKASSQVVSELPVFLFSHSMGTLVAALAQKSIPNLRGIIFSATPIFSGPAASSPFGLRCLYPLVKTSAALLLTRLLAFLAPKGAAAPILVEGLTTDQHEIDLIKRDSRMYNGDIMNKTAFEIIKMIAAVKEELPNIKTPLLCLHGSDDQVSLLSGSELIMSQTITAYTDKSLIVFPGCLHEILHSGEMQREKWITSIVEYCSSKALLTKDVMVSKIATTSAAVAVTH